MEKLTLCKYLYFEGCTTEFEPNLFIFFGEIPNMIGHGFYLQYQTGEPYIFDLGSMIELTEEEL
jgi:hypothetical protein